MEAREYNMGEATVFGAGAGVGFFLAIVAIAAIREKIRYSHVPPALRGLGMAFIITGLMGIAFMSFLGIDLDKKEKKEESTTEQTQQTPTSDDKTTSLLDH